VQSVRTVLTTSAVLAVAQLSSALVGATATPTETSTGAVTVASDGFDRESSQESDSSTDEGKHVISVRAVHELHGEFDEDFIKDDGDLRKTAVDLQFHKERSLSLTCGCGRRFLKYATAADHLREVSNRGE